MFAAPQCGSPHGSVESPSCVSVPSENPEKGRCNFYLSGKKARFCRSLAVPGQRYCGNHLQGAAVAAPRVPCPLDPNHTVLVSELEVHVAKRCPALALALRERAQPHFLENVNAGSDCEPDLPPPPAPPAPAAAPPAGAPAPPAHPMTATAPGTAPAATSVSAGPAGHCSGAVAIGDGDGSAYRAGTELRGAQLLAGPLGPPGEAANGVSSVEAAALLPPTVAASQATAAATCAEAAAVAAGEAGAAVRTVPALGPFQKGRAAQRAALARSLGEEAFGRLLARVEAAYAAACGGVPPPPCVARPAECEEMLAAPSDHRPFDLKHGLQQASIVGNMQRAGLIEPGPQGGSGAAVVELGAGKGYLGGSLAACCGVRLLVATDIKAGLKLKADRHLRHIVFARHRVDLKDYVPAATPELTSAAAAGPGNPDSAVGASTAVAGTGRTVPWIAVAKHLCGAATDYGLRACMLPPHAKRFAEATTAGAAGAAPAIAKAAAADGGISGTANGTYGRGGENVVAEGRDGERTQGEKRPRREGDADASLASQAPASGQHGEACARENGREGAEAQPSCASGSGSGEGSGGSGGGVSLRGLAIAPCCHHRCGWRAYVGKPLFRRLGLSAHDFELMSWMTGWALCGHDTPAGVPTSAARPSDGSDGDEEDADPCGCGAGPECDDAANPMNGDAMTATEVPCSGGAFADQQSPQAPLAQRSQPQHPDGSPSEPAASQLQVAPAAAAEPGGMDVSSQAPLAENRQPAPARPPTRFDPAATLSRARRMAVGQMCKQIIDAGRLDWLRSRFRSAELVSYIGPEVTGENRLLLAVEPMAGAGGGGVGSSGTGAGTGAGGGAADGSLRAGA